MLSLPKLSIILVTRHWYHYIRNCLFFIANEDILRSNGLDDHITYLFSQVYATSGVGFVGACLVGQLD